MRYFNINNRELFVKKEIGSGGEAIIYSLEKPFDDYVIKIYNSPLSEKRKQAIICFINLELAEPFDNNISWSKPKFIVFSENKDFIGYGMLLIKNKIPITKFISFYLRMQFKMKTNWRFHITVAKNICILVERLHNNNFVIGDIKDSNILVNKKGLPTIIDFDSFSYKDDKNQVINSLATMGYHPPEFNSLDSFIYEKNHDYFKLAIIIFELLFGEHPFQDFENNSGNPPQDLINLGIWIGNQKKYFPHRLLAYDYLPPNIQECFSNSFDNFLNRTSSQKWINELNILLQSLKECSVNNNHFYIDNICFWCEKQKRLNFDYWNKVVPILEQPVNTVTEPTVSENKNELDYMSSGTLKIKTFLNRNVNKYIILNNIKIVGFQKYYTNSVIFETPIIDEFTTLRIVVHKKCLIHKYNLYDFVTRDEIINYLNYDSDILDYGIHNKVKGTLKLKQTKKKRFYQIVFPENRIFNLHEV